MFLIDLLLIYFSEPKCSVVSLHGTCETETIVTGNCAYSNQFSSQCQYMVTTGINSNGDFSAEVTIGDDRKIQLVSPGSNVKDCASFSLRGSVLVITEATCDRCIFEFIRNIAPRNTCT